MEIQKTSEIIKNNTVNAAVLVYGEGGSGKTWFASTFPKPLFLATEDGLVGLALNGKNIDYIRVNKFIELKEFVNNLHTDQGYIKTYKTIVLDSLTSLTPYIVEYVLSITGKSRPTIQDWGMVVDELRQLIINLTSLKYQYNVVVTARTEIDKDENTGIILAGPDTVGKFTREVDANFDVFLYSDCSVINNKAKWVVYSKKYMMFPAKDRLGCFNIVESNDYNTIKDKLKVKQPVKTAVVKQSSKTTPVKQATKKEAKQESTKTITVQKKVSNEKELKARVFNK